VKIEELLTRPEGKTLEFKQDLSSSQSIVKTVLAFANTAGGIIIIGVENNTKALIGLKDPLEEEERLSNIIADLVEPLLIPDIVIINWEGTTLLAVEVCLSSSRPHYLKSVGIDGGVYVRVGSTNRVADAALINELKRTAVKQSFDEEPLPDLNPEAVDLRVASGLFSGFRQWDQTMGETLNLLVRHQGHLVPSVGGILLFGKDREQYFPDAWIKCGRFAGTNKANILDQLDIHEHLPLSIEKAFEFVKKHASQSAEFGELQRKDVWNIPLIAVREALINAIVHADYSQSGAPIHVAIFDDRIEIENPGLLTPGLTIEDVRSGVSKLRNRVIGRVFRELNLIEQWGSGFQRMADSCREMSLPEPTFEEISMRFRVSINLKRIKIDTLLDEKEEMIMQIIFENEAKGGVSTKEISNKVGISDRAVRTRLSGMLKSGRIVTISKSAYDPNKRYLPAKE